MGTLTAGCPRLDEHCPHKLATSCRLTSTPNCCACADERAHSLTYRVYIDGVGFVQRGTRWQSYCWFCKEFWNNRLAATDPPLQTSQTRIPAIPNQTEFLQKWFEFHQGYRIVRDTNGTERRITVIGEPLEDVSPGFLPRTLNELREARENNAQRPANRFRRRRLSSEDERPQMPQQSIEDALDSLLEAASDDEADEADQAPEIVQMEPVELEANPSQPLEENMTPDRADVRAQRLRERFARIYGTREEIEQDDYESPLTTMYSRAWQRHRQAEERRVTGQTQAPPLDSLSAAERRDIEQQMLWGVLRDSRQEIHAGMQADDLVNTHAQLLRDLETQVGEDEESRRQLSTSIERDLSRMLARLRANRADQGQAYELENRIQDLDRRVQTIEPDSRAEFFTQPIPENLTTTLFPTTRAAPSIPVTTTMARPSSSSSTNLVPAPPTVRSAELRASIQRINEDLARIRALADRDLQQLDMDKQDRPPALEDADMTRVLACQVCYSQLADMALLPCGHMVMCQWCADTVVPVKHSHVPVRPTRCPLCRKAVKQRFKIHM